MRFLKIEEDEQKVNFIRSCAGADLMEFWEKVVRARFEAMVEEGGRRRTRRTSATTGRA